MLTFFSKKKFLIDYLENFVDIHSHILPGIDDGARTVEDSIGLIRAFGDFGVNRFIATPHIMQDYYPNNPKTILASLSIVNHELAARGLDHVSLVAAAEHMIDSNFGLLLEQSEVMPLKKNYLLIEMSYLQPSINFEESIRQIASNRFFAILAHPERYIYLQKRTKKYEIYKKKGILFQLNLLSLSEYYGKSVRQTAFKLLDEGFIDYVASDVHNLAQVEKLKEIRISNKLLNKLFPLIENTIYDFY